MLRWVFIISRIKLYSKPFKLTALGAGQPYQDPWSVHLGGRFHRHGLCWLARKLGENAVEERRWLQYCYRKA